MGKWVVFEAKNVPIQDVTWVPMDTTLGPGAHFIDLRRHLDGFAGPTVSLGRPSVDLRGPYQGSLGPTEVPQVNGHSVGLRDLLVGVRGPRFAYESHLLERSVCIIWSLISLKGPLLV